MMMKTPTPPKAAVDELYRKIRSFVRRRVSQVQDQEDLVQEIFLKFKKNLPQVREEDRILPWLYRIADNQVTDYYRSKKIPSVSESSLTSEEGSVSENSAEQEVAGWLKYFIRNLKAEDQEILQLVELEGKTQKEAAEHLSLSLPAAKSRHQRAKQRLKQDLENCCRYFLDARGTITGYQANSSGPCDCH